MRPRPQWGQGWRKGDHIIEKRISIVHKNYLCHKGKVFETKCKIYYTTIIPRPCQ